MTELYLTARRAGVVLAGLCIGLFGSASSAMIVANALPAISREVGGDPALTLWVVVASLLAMTAAMPLWGRLADHFDGKRVIQLALLVFVIGCLGAGFAPGLGVLIAARAVQGIALGGMLVCSQAVLAAVTSPRSRGAYLGYLGAIMSIASLIGPVVGGVVVDAPGLGWRWCFFLLLPLSLAALLIIQLALPAQESRGGFRIDAVGMLLLVIAPSALLIWVTFAGSAFAWVSWPSLILVAIGVVSGAMLIVVERGREHPVLDVRQLRIPAVAWSTVGSASIGTVMFSALLYLSQYWQLGRGETASMSGVYALPMLGATLVVSIAAGHIATHPRGLGAVLIGGAVSLVVGLAGLSAIGAATPVWFVLLCGAVVGAGMGALMQNFVVAAQRGVPRETFGRVGALVSTTRSLSGALGVSVLGALLVAWTVGVPGADAYADATGALFLVCAVLSSGSLVAAVALRRAPSVETP